MSDPWKCPKCGRTFARREQSHYCEKPGTVDAYIAAQDEAVRPALERMRGILRAAVPDAEERIAWSMPTLRKGRDLIHFAASKRHLGLYPGDEAVAAFAEELRGYDVSKGTIRFPYGAELPEALIAAIARWCRDRYGR